MDDQLDGVTWVTSRFCNNSACAEVGRDGDEILVRSSRDPKTVTRLTPDEWAAFQAGVRAGDFD